MTCPICGQQTITRLDVIGQIGWAVCACGVVFQDVKHLDDAVYNQGYTKKYDDPGIRAKIRKVGERWLPTVEEKLGRVGRLLEIGYCLPEVMTYARSRGWEIAGCEINPTAPNGDFPRFVGNFETLPLDELGPSTWDCVFSNHVFEHFRDPLRALDKMVALLKPDGVLFLATPDAGGKIEGHLHRKEHHVMWTADALKAQIEQRGLTVHEIEHHEGEECGFISWFDFHLLAQRAPVTADSRELAIVGATMEEDHGGQSEV
jgi:SAM-dependent methyltransferase